MMVGRRLLSLRLAVSFAVLCAGSMAIYAISQEPPVGSLSGKAIARETGSPLPAEIYLMPVGRTSFQHATADEDGKFSLSRIPAGKYTLRASTSYHSIENVAVEVQEGRTQHLDLSLAPQSPSLHLYVHQHIFLPGEKPRITIQGFVPDVPVEIRLYKLDAHAFLVDSQGSIEKLLGRQPYGGDGNPIDLQKNKALTLVSTEPLRITKRDSEGAFTQRHTLSAMDRGIYIAEVKTKSLQALDYVMVTTIAMVTKTAERQVLAYTVDLKTGTPISGSEVSVYVAGKPAGSGTTDANGVLDLQVPKAEKGEDNQTTVAASGGSIAFVTQYLSSTESSHNVIYTYTERPVYKPGQTVYFKGIVRQNNDGKYSVPVALPLVVEVRDRNDTLIYRGKHRTDKFGAYAGSFNLNSEAATGDYAISTSIENQHSENQTTFRVAAYRKPEYSVKVKFDKPRYIRGDVAHAKVSANYYFGAPLANMSLHYIVRRTPYWLFEDQEMDSEGDMGGESEYEGGYHDYGGYGEQVVEGSVRTDPNGEAAIEFPAKWEQSKERYSWDSDQHFSIEVSASDQSGQEVTGSASTVVTRGEFALDVTSDIYIVNPGEPVNLSIHARDYDKHPVAGHALTVAIGRETWTGKEMKFDLISERQLTTDKEGDASTKFTVDKKVSVKVVVKAVDSRGNAISSSQYFWSSEYEGESDREVSDLQIVTDKKMYKAGDRAKVLIRTSKPGATALVTVEGSRVSYRKTVKLERKSTLVRIPVEAEYKPNFYIGVCYVKNKNFANQQARVKVSMGEQALKIDVLPNKRKYLPGENAVYRIKVRDAKGKPASAQLSVGVVDESIYAIQEETTTPILDYFYARKPNMVSTSFSFPQIYLSDPDKAGTGLLTSEKRNIRIRKKFLDTAFWNPFVETNDRGEATVKFKMPDNLTTWRTTVRGITMDTLCGETKSTVLARQDFMVRLEMPRFLIESDKTTIGAIVHNYTGADRRVVVNLIAPSLEVGGETRRTVTVKDNGSERVEWSVKAQKIGDAEVTVRAATDKYGDAMQLSLPVQPHGVRHDATQVGSVSSTTGVQVHFDIGRDSVPGVNRLQVRLAPSLASSLLGSLDYLAMYPWGCTEQTTSSFLPDVVLSRSMKELGLHNPKLEAQLPDMVQKGLLRLYRFQLQDGGWSWCEYGKSDPWMTAYVCYGLLRAKEAGFPVNATVLNRGLEKLPELLGEAKKPVNSKDRRYIDYMERMDDRNRAYMAYVLSMAGKDETDKVSDVENAKSIDARTAALLALTYANLHSREKAEMWLDRLFQRAIQERDLIYWRSGEDWWHGDEVETAALGLTAVLKLKPNDPRIYSIVRWLMERRRGDAWYSTRDTAITLYAMSDFLKLSKELTPDYDAEVLVNGESVAKRHFGKDSVYEPQVLVEVPERLLHTGQNTLEIRKIGTGVVYWSSMLSQYEQNELRSPSPTGRGLTIKREYFHPSKQYFEKESIHDLGKPVNGASVGDLIIVHLTIDSKTSYDHLLLEDMIPAGCEIVDRGDVNFDSWYNWWAGQDVRDDRIAFYIDDLSPGRQVIEYRMRAGFTGNYHAMPAQIFQMYEPEVRAATAETEFTVR